MFGKQITFIFLFRFLFQNECTHDYINFIVHPFCRTLFLSYHCRKFYSAILHGEFMVSNYCGRAILYADKNEFQI